MNTHTQTVCSNRKKRLGLGEDNFFFLSETQRKKKDLERQKNQKQKKTLADA